MDAAVAAASVETEDGFPQPLGKPKSVFHSYLENRGRFPTAPTGPTTTTVSIETEQDEERREEGR